MSAIRGVPVRGTKFSTVVLLDDFSASGRSYYMPKDNGAIGGKIAKFHRKLVDPDSRISALVDRDQLELVILLYVATEQALDHLQECSGRLWGEAKIPSTIKVVQKMPEDLRLTREDGGDFGRVIGRYYDHSVHDPHMQKGGTPDSRYGFADCGLPLVLHHNTPNNSVALLWSYEDRSVRGLFPRIRRHKEAP